jgi:hypothetical protein
MTGLRAGSWRCGLPPAYDIGTPVVPATNPAVRTEWPGELRPKIAGHTEDFRAYPASLSTEVSRTPPVPWPQGS